LSADLLQEQRNAMLAITEDTNTGFKNFILNTYFNNLLSKV